MAHAENSYYIPHGTRWPVTGSIGLFGIMTGASMWLNGAGIGPYVFAFGFAILIYMIFGLMILKIKFRVVALVK